MYQMKEQYKTPEKQLNEEDIGNLTEKEFRIMIVKMIQDFGKRMEAKIEKMQEMFNKDLEELKNKHLEELKNKQTEMNNTITEMKNTEASENIVGAAVKACVSYYTIFMFITFELLEARVYVLLLIYPLHFYQ